MVLVQILNIYVQLMLFLLKVLFFKMFAVILPVKQKFSKLCDTVMGNHVEARENVGM
jgi:hypothetical protein